MVMHEAINYSCSLLYNIPLCGYTISYSIVYEHLCSCQFFTITDITAMNVLMLVYVIKIFPKVREHCWVTGYVYFQLQSIVQNYVSKKLAPVYT